MRKNIGAMPSLKKNIKNSFDFTMEMQFAENKKVAQYFSFLICNLSKK